MDFMQLQFNPLFASKKIKRFDPIRFIAQRNDYFDVASSIFVDEFPSLPVVGRYRILDVPYRPDMIAYDLYRDTQFWWLIMLFNNEIFLEKLAPLRWLNYFSMSDLDKLFYSLSNRTLPATKGRAVSPS